ncbi:MAG: HPr family phosphocarrier protein [Spirochaetes bacterium]|nr:HPr family phosphocarrier protein [Spirochaetota bacterium]
MLTKRILIKNKYGLHMRVASKIVKASAGHDAQVILCSGCNRASSCSMMEMLMLGAAHGSELDIIVCGKNDDEEQQALNAVADIVEDGAGI